MIKEYREKCGYTQEEFAEKLKISVRHMQRIENKESNPSITLFKKIVELLDIRDEDIGKIIRDEILYSE